MKCKNCGSDQPDQAKFCAYCGSAIQQAQPAPQYNQSTYYQQPQAQYAPPNEGYPPQAQYAPQNQGYQPQGQPYSTKPKKDKVIAGVLAILVGGFGVHKFYLGDIGLGILYLIFFWTGIPAIIGLIEGILYLVASDDEFQQKYVKG